MLQEIVRFDEYFPDESVHSRSLRLVRCWIELIALCPINNTRHEPGIDIIFVLSRKQMKKQGYEEMCMKRIT